MTYKNPEIFKSIDDYIIGGFTMKQLNNIHTPKSVGEINQEKIFACINIRLEIAIEEYLKDVKKAYDLQGKINSEGLALGQLDDVLNSYLGIRMSGESILDIANTIKLSSQYASWFTKMKSRIDNQKDISLLVGMVGSEVANVGESEETVNESVEEPNLLEILEKLSQYA